MKNKTKIMMKASVLPKFGSENDLAVQLVEKPEPKDNEILIKVNYALVTPTDIVADEKSSKLEKLFSSLFRPKSGVYGEMFSGQVEVVGKAVENIKINDIVYGTNGLKLGAYAEYVCVKDTSVIKTIPNDLKEVDVLTLLDGGITALPFLRDKGQIEKDQKVLIIGASGSVGSMAVQLAKYYGALVTGVCSTKNVEKVTSLGCDLVIDYTKTDYTTMEDKYDIVFDAVGKSSFKKCTNILKEEGRYLVTVPTLGIMLKNLFIKNQKGKKVLFSATGLRKPSLKMADLDFLETLVRSQNIKPLIEKIYSLQELTEAQKIVRTGHKVGNIIMKVN